MGHSHRIRAFHCVAACVLFSTAALGKAPVIKRESGHNHAVLKEIETRPFDRTTIASLTDWTHEGVLDETNTTGKVVVLAVVSDGYPMSYMTISKLTRLRENYKDSGLVVAAIHPDIGFDLIQKKIASGKVTIPVARDADGVFASAMHTDDYPDIYIIDRAGLLRFADLDGRGLKDALKLLTSETPEQAIRNAALQSQGLPPEQAAAPKSTADAASQAGLEAMANAAETTPEMDPETQVPTATVILASEAQYESAKWPKHNPKSFKAGDFQGNPLPVPLDSDKWFYNERDFSHKIVVISFFSTWSSSSTKAIPVLEEQLSTHSGRVEVIGINFEEHRKLKRFLERTPTSMAIMSDKDRTLYKAMKIQGMPQVVVLSTDGVIRWQGDPNDPDFIKALDKIVEADPGFSGG